jgi:DNA-binding response OmpR family regulator
MHMHSLVGGMKQYETGRTTFSGEVPAPARERPQAPICLHAESHCASYENKMVRLTKSEFLLAKLFIGRLGSVISLSELFALFSSHGKAATRSNVRVGIFELRLKLEQLSGSTLGLVSVYRQGYALRQTSCRDALQ